MKWWVRCSLWVLVPVVLYGVSYVGCCLYPRGNPTIFAAHISGMGEWDRPRIMKTAYAPLLAIHRRVVVDRMARSLEGNWERVDGSVGRFEFAMGENGHLTMSYFGDRGRRMKTGLSWVTGTGMVGMRLDTKYWPGSIFELVDSDKLMLYEISMSDVHRSRGVSVKLRRVPRLGKAE